MNLADLKVIPHPRGFMHRELFDNGYGISIIPEEDGEHYEVAVLEHSKGHKAHLTYDTVITDDVLRYCTVNAVDTLIERIRNLPPRTFPASVFVTKPQPNKNDQNKNGYPYLRIP